MINIVGLRPSSLELRLASRAKRVETLVKADFAGIPA